MKVYRTLSSNIKILLINVIFNVSFGIILNTLSLELPLEMDNLHFDTIPG